MPTDPREPTTIEVKRLRRLHTRALEAGTDAAARRPEAQLAWQALYREVAACVARGRSRARIAKVLGVSKARAGQMCAEGER